MKLKFKIALLLIMLVNICSYAQDGYTVKGTVTSQADNEVLPGVTVIIQGTTRGTETDFDGNFSIEVKSGDVLSFSYLGYAQKNVTITDQKVLNVSLAEDASELDEIVVVGYGTRKRSQISGAVAKIGGEDVAAVQVARVDDALAGKLSGVLIQNQDGSPGAAPKIQIRAASSISGASNPLIVVDGYPISGGLETINPNDIESLEILKDAASAAIYGSRGANGVVLVTTKKGKTGAPKFSYNTYFSASSKYRDNILMSGPEWASYARSEIAAGNWAATADNDATFLEYRLSAYEDSPGAISPEDWLFQTGTTQNHDFSVSGGTEDTKYFASVGYQNAEGVVITQGFERMNARLNVDANLGDKFKAGLSFNGFVSDRDILAHDMRDLLRSYGVHSIYHTEESIAFVQQLDQQAQALGLEAFDVGYRGSTYEASSIYELEPGMAAQDWHYGRNNNGIGGSGDAGPAAKLDNVDSWQKTFFGNVSGYLQYQIIEGLNVKTVLGGDMKDTQTYAHRLLGYDSRARDSQTFMDQIDLKVSSVLSETTLSYATKIGKHDISAVAGVEFQNTRFIGTRLDGSNVPDEAILNYNLFDPADIIVTERDETRVRESVFGRVNYAYDDRFLVSASLRRDGDSRFGANKRYETFPAISLGWNLHNESFLKENELLSRLKVRFSTGSLGTTSFLGSYDSLSLLDPSATIYGTGYLIPSNSNNPDLTWQTNTETNFGVDFGFLNNRFTLGIDYYTSDIEDILINQAQSEVLGNPTSILNVGDVKSSGLEFEISGSLMNTEDFSWNMGANLSTVNTEITYLGGLDELPQQIFGQSGRGAVFRNYVGGGIGEMWGLETIGDVEMTYLADGTRHPNSQTGESYVVDQNGDGVIDRTRTVEDGGDLVMIGQNTPDFYWGMSHNFRYKDFDMSFQLQGSHGAEVYNIDPLYYGSQWGGRLDYAMLDANSDGIADHNGEYYERNRNQTDAMIQDASYVALRNLTIGYTLKSDVTDKIGFSSIRFYGAATNLLYLMGSDYTSYNPEGVNTTDPTVYGAQVGASPVVRSFTIGLNVNF
ncbi:SusC/RagA family TonB-linked outer membrane protein [Polaribacter reichenbachii]|uniref:SusC/RagA family TonB-linked outer membrane protein n=1 Tax=Polaribacter reichenbachii TaxID=996801 RepID=A0A1B8U6L1_9FLAO|nr:TonB-dependent receptor [Polaribacter reichenbachii]APZ46134.1 SusC/RagA family TonB-linked outer membrane protein [Polaribacter reichenbachii]AUC19996.1 SusC/RagA family TonB-linked outer membrane protein [Polaribacter reichenbachii]OBY67458.1 SusC/RagA family TonB-linked outer membrane protein [Polaribacter reichenbachii]